MTLTVTDLFCGGGGSSTGLMQIAGFEIKIAANHWDLAVDVHNRNHPDADHSAADLHLEDPRFFPRTDVLWASPECTKWSQANGSKPLPAIEEGLFEDPLSDDAARRSRLLMFDVLRFAEHHMYRVMMIENVVDIATQPKYALAWSTWKRDLYNLGYDCEAISLNSMHAQTFGLPAPQSRDRIYIVCWRRGDRKPDFQRILRPKAYCPKCELVIEARQAWKKGRTVGRYRQQYLYVHGECGTPVEPGWLPASYAIDWTIAGKRIGDRAKPLADKTRRRIAAGIARYWRPFHLETGGNQYDAADPKHRNYGDPNAYYRAWQLEEWFRTFDTSDSRALAIPVEGRDGKEARPIGLPLRTQTTRLETALAYAPDLHVSLMGGSESHLRNSARPVDDYELRTLTAEGNNDYLLSPYYGSSDSARPVTQPIGTLTTHDRYALISPAGGTWNDDARPVSDAMRSLTTREAYALVTRFNSSRGEGAEMTTPAGEYLRTLTSKGHQGLLTPGDLEAAESQVDDCLLRMLEPHECAAGMAFPRDYIWDGRNKKGRLATRRAKVKLAGNAVTPPSARDVGGVVMETYTGEAA